MARGVEPLTLSTGTKDRGHTSARDDDEPLEKNGAAAGSNRIGSVVARVELQTPIVEVSRGEGSGDIMIFVNPGFVPNLT